MSLLHHNTTTCRPPSFSCPQLWSGIPTVPTNRWPSKISRELRYLENYFNGSSWTWIRPIAYSLHFLSTLTLFPVIPRHVRYQKIRWSIAESAEPKSIPIWDRSLAQNRRRAWNPICLVSLSFPGNFPPPRIFLLLQKLPLQIHHAERHTSLSVQLSPKAWQYMAGMIIFEWNSNPTSTSVFPPEVQPMAIGPYLPVFWATKSISRVEFWLPGSPFQLQIALIGLIQGALALLVEFYDAWNNKVEILKKTNLILTMAYWQILRVLHLITRHAQYL